MRFLILACLLCVPLSAANAQDGHFHDPELRDAAKVLVASPGQQLAVDEMLSKDAMLSQIEMLAPELTDEQEAAIETIVGEEFAAVRGKIEESMENAITHLFTLEEIEALDAFYRTKEGAAIAEKMQIFDSNVFVELGSALEDTRSKIMERVEAALQ